MEVFKKVGKSLIQLLLIFTCLMQISYAVTVDKIVAFGDSLSDNGNLYALTKRTHKVLPFVPVIPASPPYYEGRFSNGENWLDVLSKKTNLPLVDHAYGGAWAEPVWQSAQVIPFDISEQVSLYIMENALDRHKDRHLFIIWAGANDYLQGREDIDYASTNTVSNIKKQIERLIYHGAHQLLIANLPDISKTPDVINQGPVIVKETKELVELHNKKLAAAIKEVQEKNPKIIIIQMDAKEPFDALQANPSSYNIKNIKDPCYGGYFYRGDTRLVDQNELAAAKEFNLDIMSNESLRVAYMTSKLAQRGGNICANPDEYLYWDQIHPTRVIHQVIATLVILELNANHIEWLSHDNNN